MEAALLLIDPIFNFQKSTIHLLSGRSVWPVRMHQVPLFLFLCLSFINFLLLMIEAIGIKELVFLTDLLSTIFR